MWVSDNAAANDGPLHHTASTYADATRAAGENHNREAIMGGSVVFAEGNSVGLSTIQFHRLEGMIRDAFRLGEEDVREEVFSPFDEGAMNFLSAVELAADKYLIFCSVIERAHAASKDSGHVLIGERLWEEILDAMVRDPRYPK